MDDGRVGGKRLPVYDFSSVKIPPPPPPPVAAAAALVKGKDEALAILDNVVQSQLFFRVMMVVAWCDKPKKSNNAQPFSFKLG